MLWCHFLFSVGTSACSVLSAIMSHLFQSRNKLQFCDLQDSAAALKTDYRRGGGGGVIVWRFFFSWCYL